MDESEIQWGQQCLCAVNCCDTFYARCLTRCGSVQRSFVALLTVASHSNTGRLALDQPGSASGRQLILSAHMEAGGVRASFATAP